MTAGGVAAASGLESGVVAIVEASVWCAVSADCELDYVVVFLDVVGPVEIYGWW